MHAFQNLQALLALEALNWQLLCIFGLRLHDIYVHRVLWHRLDHHLYNFSIFMLSLQKTSPEIWFIIFCFLIDFESNGFPYRFNFKNIYPASFQLCSIFTSWSMSMCISEYSTYYNVIHPIGTSSMPVLHAHISSEMKPCYYFPCYTQWMAMTHWSGSFDIHHLKMMTAALQGPNLSYQAAEKPLVIGICLGSMLTSGPKMSCRKWWGMLVTPIQ